jgi:hypothetical protein
MVTGRSQYAIVGVLGGLLDLLAVPILVVLVSLAALHSDARLIGCPSSLFVVKEAEILFSDTVAAPACRPSWVIRRGVPPRISNAKALIS